MNMNDELNRNFFTAVKEDAIEVIGIRWESMTPSFAKEVLQGIELDQYWGVQWDEYVLAELAEQAEEAEE